MGQIFVKASRRARAHTRRKSRTSRAAGLSARYNAAIKTLNALPGPSTGIYGMGGSLDKQYRRASAAARRIGGIMQNNGLIASTGKASNYLPGTGGGTLRINIKKGGFTKMTKGALAKAKRIQRAVRMGR